MASLRSFLPRSLFGRALAILLVPIVVLQLVVGLVFFQRHYQRVTEQMTRNVAYELAYGVEEIDTAGDPAQAALRISQLSRPLDLWLRLDPGATLRPGVVRDFFDITGAKVVETFQSAFREPLHIDLSDAHGAVLRIQTSLGVLEATIPRTRLSVSNPHQLLVLMILAALLLTAVAILFLRNPVRPIRAMAEAA
jgi:two-component system osmolarity sensor histidine kinase EnvZ